MYGFTGNTQFFKQVFVTLTLLGLIGCSQKISRPQPGTTAPPPAEKHPANKQSTRPKPAAPTTINRHNQTEKPDPDHLCVFKVVKGIAEVRDFEENVVRLKFYPGDDLFELPVSRLDPLNIYKGMEIKMIKQEPVSGPCDRTQFQVKSPAQ